MRPDCETKQRKTEEEAIDMNQREFINLQILPSGINFPFLSSSRACQSHLVTAEFPFADVLSSFEFSFTFLLFDPSTV